MHDRARRGRFPRTSELAAELLDIVNETELDEFLEALTASERIPAGAHRALVARLRQTAERTLPSLAVALPAGTVASSAAQDAARAFGLELEGMSGEDRDYEIAREFVRFAQTEAERAAR
jgi:hypothetical protein